MIIYQTDLFIYVFVNNDEQQHYALSVIGVENWLIIVKLTALSIYKMYAYLTSVLYQNIYLSVL